MPPKEINPNNHSRAALKAAKVAEKKVVKDSLDHGKMAAAKDARQNVKAEKLARDVEKKKKAELEDAKAKRKAATDKNKNGAEDSLIAGFK
jgi:hypothetical protein